MKAEGPSLSSLPPHSCLVPQFSLDVAVHLCHRLHAHSALLTATGCSHPLTSLVFPEPSFTNFQSRLTCHP